MHADSQDSKPRGHHARRIAGRYRSKSTGTSITFAIYFADASAIGRTWPYSSQAAPLGAAGASVSAAAGRDQPARLDYTMFTSDG